MVRFQLRHGNDLLAMDCLRSCDVRCIFVKFSTKSFLLSTLLLGIYSYRSCLSIWHGAQADVRSVQLIMAVFFKDFVDDN